MRGERLYARLFRAVCLGFSAALLVLTLFCQIRLVRLNSRIGELEKAIALAENEKIRLRVRTDEALNLKELERRAIQELGLRHPEPGQIVETDRPE